MKTDFFTGPAFFAVMAVLFAALFVLNVATHGSWFGIVGTGGLAVAMGYQAWLTKRRTTRKS
ncbi:MAG: hypothetical protein U0R77_13480 [Mycolicibacterium insubricum]|nr:hypothetical protein [Mycobacterium sp.]